MIIFGWGHQTTKIFGPTFKNYCNHCNNEEYWVLARFMTWFTLFFIPVFPYSIKYFLSCPICQCGLTLDGEQIKKIKPIAEANQLLIDGEITEAEYKMKINQLENGDIKQIEEQQEEQKTINKNKESDFCVECGAKLNNKMKFCGNCGAKVTKNSLPNNDFWTS